MGHSEHSWNAFQPLPFRTFQIQQLHVFSTAEQNSLTFHTVLCNDRRPNITHPSLCLRIQLYALGKFSI